MLFVAVRMVYLFRLFPALRIVSHVARALAPTVPATAVVLVAREVFDGSRTPARAIAELVVFLVVVLLATLVLERRLLAEAIGYLRGPLANTNAWSSNSANPRQRPRFSE